VAHHGQTLAAARWRSSGVGGAGPPGRWAGCTFLPLRDLGNRRRGAPARRWFVHAGSGEGRTALTPAGRFTSPSRPPACDDQALVVATLVDGEQSVPLSSCDEAPSKSCRAQRSRRPEYLTAAFQLHDGGDSRWVLPGGSRQTCGGFGSGCSGRHSVARGVRRRG